MNFNISKDEKVCVNCKYYRSYFALENEESNIKPTLITDDGRKLIQIYKGDCQSKERKSRRVKCPFDEACYLFEEIK